MRIGIDISQLAYQNTGVSNYLTHLVEKIVDEKNNEYILFYSSLRQDIKEQISNFQKNQNVKLKIFRFPPTLLDFLWNKLHIMPVEYLIGPVDIFITSDWTEPPTKKAKKAAILYDLIIYKHPNETHKRIIDVQKRKLKWVKKESDIVFCISEASKNDAEKILKIEKSKLKVVYPGLTI